MAQRKDSERSILQTTVPPDLLEFVTQQVEIKSSTTSQYLRDLIVNDRLDYLEVE
ncbi:hypothetical protein N9C85_00990 [Synechococcus sp. AH-224-I15]|nr:hypothetical protein [Synechococcus sp. AH-224-I15]